MKINSSNRSFFFDLIGRSRPEAVLNPEPLNLEPLNLEPLNLEPPSLDLQLFFNFLIPEFWYKIQVLKRPDVIH
jgi:hypothetical protein